MNDTGDVYTPELKIKYFLDCLAYFLLIGYTDGIETYYKKIMHAKREIPASNCPSEIDNLLYASGSYDSIREEEDSAFEYMLEQLDRKAAPYEFKKVEREKKQSRFAKKLKKGIHDGKWYRVDTEGKFWADNKHYIIEDQEVQYQPIQTEYGDYYAMDRILVANGQFYDMNYDEVKVQVID